MKGMARVLWPLAGLLLAGVMLFSGCSQEDETIVIGKGSNAEAESASSEEESTSASTEEIAEEPAEAEASSTESEEATSTSEESTEEPVASLTPEAVGPPASQIFFDPFYTEKNEETAEITGLSSVGEELWKVEAGKYPATELVQVKEIGIENDLYYYLEGGKVVALDLRTGKPAWTNKEFGGASASAVFDEQGTLYLCGFYRPDLFVVDKSGHTVTRVELYDQAYDQPDSISLGEDTMTIHYASNNGTLTIDRETYKIIGNVAPDNGFTTDELMALVLRYSGEENAEVEVREESDTEVLLHVYYDGAEAIETVNWYWIDPRTGEGEDVNGTYVDLKTIL